MYYAKVNWFNEFKETDTISHVIVLGTDWNEAMAKINDEFTYINSIEMTQLHDIACNVVYITEDMIDGIIMENNW